MKKITSHPRLEFFITVLSLFFALNVSAQNIDSTVVACYPFDGNALDRSGYGHHGTVIGATLSTDRFGNPNSCYYFNGNTDYIAVPVFNTIVPTDEITISFWAKSDSSDYSAAFCLSPDTNNDRFNISVDYITGTNGFYWDYGNIFTGGRCANLNVPFVSQWAHYVCTSSASQDSMKVFKNTNLIASCNTHSTIINRSRTLFIGGAGITLQHYHGYIDDVRIYNRVLTTTEVLDLYDNPSLCPLVTGIGEMSLENVFALYPNPVSSLLTFTFAKTENYLLTITNALGETVLSKPITEKEFSADVKDFPAGIYFVTVTDEKKNVAVKKFVKM